MITTKKAFIISLVLTLLLFLFDVSKKSSYFFASKENFLVSRVIDGDTLELSNGEKVRLIGINAPEIGDFLGEEAKNFLASLVEGKMVDLEADYIERDEYGRRLVFLFLDGRNINVEMVRNGLAHTFGLGKVSKYVNELKEAESYAIKEQIGIWKKSNITCIKLIDLKIVGNEKVVLKNGCNFSIQLKNWSLKDESNNLFKFPSYTFKPNEVIEIYSTNKTAKFSFKKEFQIWNKEGDSLFLRDSQGLLVLFYRY
ncbi:MAG: thermonuclease family protein [Candidatus Aenigmarchaeota archaeon]|jgi:endonuclease YncB( thermonuclease family)|nr:thermonuclease family protein [Candidatus Aenigmarchaeota archaeon]